MQLKLIMIVLLLNLNYQHNFISENINTDFMKSYQIENEVEEIVINEMDITDGVLYIGMSFNDFKVWCEENNGWYEEVFIQTNSKDLYEGYMGAISEGISAWTSLENGNLISGFSITSDIKTNLGLKDGDSIYKMMGLYGKNYVRYDFDYEQYIYEYDMQTHYFQVNVTNDNVDGWRISNKTLEETQSEVK